MIFSTGHNGNVKEILCNPIDRIDLIMNTSKMAALKYSLILVPLARSNFHIPDSASAYQRKYHLEHWTFYHLFDE